MLKKTFVLTMFGTTFPWIQEFVDHVQHLEKYGWYWKIFTPNIDVQSRGNVEFVPMTTDQFNELVDKKLGVKPNMYMTQKGVPSVHVTDFYVATGRIFEDYLKDSHFWGITNLDVVYGRLDQYLSDSILEQCDIFTDDLETINGVFCLFRNTEKMNDLFKEIPDWKEKLAQPPCKKCLGENEEKHFLYGTDEYDMTNLVKKHPEIRYFYPKYYPLHGHDRMENHVPEIKLAIQSDGSLWELSKDVAPPNWIHARPFIGRQIMYFHFQRTKKWPPLKQ